MTEKKNVESKSSPSVQDEASSETFAKDYLVQLDNSKVVPQEILDRQEQDVKASALQRGLRPTGDVQVKSKKVVDDRNVLITYTVNVESA